MLKRVIQKKQYFLSSNTTFNKNRNNAHSAKTINLFYLLLVFVTFYTSCFAENYSNFSTTANQDHHEIPLLDLQEFLSLEMQKQAEFIEQLGEALSTYGFVLIANHDISNKKIDRAYESAKDFFDLPLDDKKNYLNIQLNRGYRSYEPERLDKKSDLQEYWHVGADLSLARSRNLGVPTVSKNIWPKEIPAFRKHLKALYQEISQKTQPILEACSLYMGKDKSFLSEQTHFGDSIMRVIHYLPNEASDGQWKAPHRDPNLLTIIVGVSMEGLELQLKDGSWIKVPYVPEAIIVSASNMLESLSNGLIRSAPHRVVIPETHTSRYSIPFFFHMQRDLSIAPQVESIAKTGGEPLYPAQTAEEALKSHQWFQPNKDKDLLEL